MVSPNRPSCLGGGGVKKEEEKKGMEYADRTLECNYGEQEDVPVWRKHHNIYAQQFTEEK